MLDLASELRRYTERVPAITLDEVTRARGRRPRRRRTLVIAVVCCCIGATAVAVVATRSPARHRVKVAGAPASSSVSGTVSFAGWHSGHLKPGVTLPLGTIAFLRATIRNTSDQTLALVHDGKAVFALACENGRLDADPSMGPDLFPFASTYEGPGNVNVTPPLAAGQSFNTFTAVTGRAIGTMTCKIVVDGNDGWRPIEPGASASIEVVSATTPTTTP